MSHNVIQFGSIVHHHNVPDPFGQPAGPHYCVVLNTADDIDDEDYFIVAVITSSFTRGQLQDGWFEIKEYIPGKPGGHEMTGMNRMSVVKLTWIVDLPKAEVRFNRKHVSVSLAKQLKAWIG